MLLSLRKNGLTSLFKEVRVFKERIQAWSYVHQKKRDDNKNKIFALHGGLAGRQGGKLSKTLFFMGNVMTIKF